MGWEQGVGGGSRRLGEGAGRKGQGAGRKGQGAGRRGREQGAGGGRQREVEWPMGKKTLREWFNRTMSRDFRPFFWLKIFDLE